MPDSLPEGGSAPAAEMSQVSTATEIQDVNQTAGPSTGDESKGEGPTSVLDAVMRGIKSDKAKTESSPSSETGTDAPGAEDQPLPDEVTTEELSRYHSRTRRRIQQLLDKNKATSTELGQLKPLAEQAQRINAFVRQSGLSAEEVDSGFTIMRLLKSDPIEARKQLLPIMQALDKVCGVELPPELKQKVDQGYVDEDTARRTAQAEARANLAANANERAAREAQQQREQAEHRQFGVSVQSAIKTFEDNWKKSDPDHAVKAPRVQEKVELSLSRMAARGEALRSPAEAVKLVEDAKKAVEAELKPFLRKREQIDPLPGGGVTANSNPKPKSMAEAIAQGLRA